MLLASNDVTAQNADALAKQLANPVASLISVPLQFNYDDGLGAGDWNMISRTIVPLIDQEDILPDSGSQSGFGDVTQSLFFSPKAQTQSGWIWGTCSAPTNGARVPPQSYSSRHRLVGPMARS